MKRLFIYLKPYRKECICAPLFKMLEATFELFVPLVIAAIIDTGIASRDTGYIVRMCLVLVALGLIGVTCSITAQYFSARAAVGFASRLRHALFEHLQSLSYTEIDRLGTSTMITRMTSDVNQTQSGVNMTLRLFLRSPFIVLGAMVMAFTIDFRSALIFAAAIVLLSLIIFVLMRISVPLMRQVQQRLDSILGITRENLTGVRVIRAFGQEEHEKAEFEQRNSMFTSVQKKAGKVSALMNPLTYVVINAAVIWLIWTGAIQVNLGILTQGQVVALYNYMSQILVELIKFANLLVTINKAIACGNRIAGVFDVTSSVKEGTVDVLDVCGAGSAPAALGEEQKAVPAVRFRHVSLTYQGSQDTSLEDIDFEAPRGSVTGIIGGTGSGKTSLVNLIPRFYEATSGSVEVNGRDVREYRYEALRRGIAVVPQKAVLFHGTIRDNMRFGCEDAADEQIMEAIRIAQASDVVEKKGGLDAVIEQGGRNLSGGQRQRLTIARALVSKPQILILDDSASALDYATDAALRKAIRELPDAPSVFIVSQRAASIRQADQIIVLDDGRMAGKGTHEELLKSCQVYQEIYYSQYQKEVQA
ncbi:MAG: ABC transporter ATP-binding protein [Lachnospiraceae bacterium]|nr:ABC transporter ATP-binding protein [Lachnospiraceae bacterium]